MSNSVVEKVVEQLEILPQELQWRVFEFARALAVSMPRGLPGEQLLQFAGTISADDLQLMDDAIEEGCERVDTNGW